MEKNLAERKKMLNTRAGAKDKNSDSESCSDANSGGSWWSRLLWLGLNFNKIIIQSF